MDTMERIEELLEEAYSTDDPGEMEASRGKCLVSMKITWKPSSCWLIPLNIRRKKSPFLRKPEAPLRMTWRIYASSRAKASSMTTRECCILR